MKKYEKSSLFWDQSLCWIFYHLHQFWEWEHNKSDEDRDAVGEEEGGEELREGDRELQLFLQEDPRCQHITFKAI